MGKIVLLLTVFYISTFASESSKLSVKLETKCLKCHIREQIPTELIHRRYLMKYSTKDEMQKAIFNYIKNPKKENSIMPPPFFFKFPMKEQIDLDDTELKEYISDFLDYLDVKKRLIIP